MHCVRYITLVFNLWLLQILFLFANLKNLFCISLFFTLTLSSRAKALGRCNSGGASSPHKAVKRHRDPPWLPPVSTSLLATRIRVIAKFSIVFMLRRVRSQLTQHGTCLVSGWVVARISGVTSGASYTSVGESRGSSDRLSCLASCSVGYLYP